LTGMGTTGYWVADAVGWAGPFPFEALQRRAASGSLGPDTQVWHAGWRGPVPLSRLVAAPPTSCPSCLTPVPAELLDCPACGRAVENVGGAATAPRGAPMSLSALLGDVLSPRHFTELFRSSSFWLLYSLAAFPLLILALEPGGTASFMFVYFSLVWAYLFFRIVQPEAGTGRLAVRVYLVTVLVAMPALLIWLSVPPHLTEALLEAGGPWRLAGFVLGVGPREEAAKLVPLALLVAARRRVGGRPLSLRQGLVLGAVAGFAFAASENVQYLRMFEAYDRQAQLWGVYSRTSLDATMARMLLTPFMHGAFSGIAGTYLVLAEWNREHRWPIRLAGLIGAALLHGLYDAVSGWPVVALLAVAFTFHVLGRCLARAASAT
jgi:protease PrsW